MPQSCIDPDPYAELDYRADAGELSEEFRKPVRVHLLGLPRLPSTHTGLARSVPHLRIRRIP